MYDHDTIHAAMTTIAMTLSVERKVAPENWERIIAALPEREAARLTTALDTYDAQAAALLAPIQHPAPSPA